MDDNELKRLAELAAGDQEDTEAEHNEAKWRRKNERWIRGLVHRMDYLRKELAARPDLENVAEETVREYMESYIRAGFR